MASTRRHNPDGARGDDAGRRDEIVRAAARLFRDKGFECTTVRDIAAAVGMQSGSPFYHFESKHEMLLAVMEQGLREALERTERAADATLPAAERLRALVREQFAIVHGEGSEFIGVMLYDWRSLPGEHRPELVALRDHIEAVWQRTLDELHASGRLDAEPKLARLMILGAVNWSVTWYRPDARGDGALDLDAIAEQTTRLFLGPAVPADARLRALRAELQAVRAHLFEAPERAA